MSWSMKFLFLIVVCLILGVGYLSYTYLENNCSVVSEGLDDTVKESFVSYESEDYNGRKTEIQAAAQENIDREVNLIKQLENRNSEVYIFNKTDNNTAEKSETYSNEIDVVSNNTDDPAKIEAEDMKLLKKAIEESKRINVLMLGLEEEPRADSMIFVSFNPETKKANIISMPRDTYYHEEGYDNGDQRKLNAAYGRGKEKGTMKAVENILCGVPVHNYISVKYNSVIEIVDALEGVEVDVPMKMGDIPEGRQTLNGEQSVKYLRFRYGYPNGDIGRVKAQQRFVKAAINKLFNSDLLTVAEVIYKSIETDMTKKETISFAIKSAGMKTDDISMKVLPGTAKYQEVGGRNWSYYIHDGEKTKEIVMELYE